MSILCVGDIHIQTNNITEIKEFSKKLQNVIKDFDSKGQCIDIVIFMGDILHTHERLHTIAFNTATDLFNDISKLKPLYILVGNHDLINNSQFLSTNHWMNCFKSTDNITIVDDVTTIEFKKNQITLCPYVPDGKFKDALDTKGNQWEKSSCIFAHQLFDGVKMGSIIAENVEKWNLSFPLVVSGHIHDKQRLQPNLIYTGSCIQHAFGESDDKTILKLTFDKEIKIEEINLNLRKKKILYMNIDDLENFDLDSLKENVEYKLTIDGSKEEFEVFKKTQKYKTLNKKVKIVFKHKRSVILEKKEKVENNNKTLKSENFNDILEKLVKQEDNPYIIDLFYSIAMNRSVDMNDILIID